MSVVRVAMVLVVWRCLPPARALPTGSGDQEMGCEFHVAGVSVFWGERWNGDR